jgi:hypothetical protein
MLKGDLNLFISFVKKGVGFLLFVICSFAIYKQVMSNESWSQYGVILHKLIFQIPFYKWLVLLLLMCLNFIIESIKWRSVVSSNNSISILNAIKGVLVGQTFAFFTPNRIGEYAGRTLFLEDGKKWMGVAQLGWASYAQLLVTIIVGAFALVINLNEYNWIVGGLFIWVRIGVPIIFIISVSLFFYKYTWKGKLKFLNILQIDTSVKVRLLLLSFFRYLIFLLQYAWVAFMLQMNIELLPLALSIAILFLFLSILPTISITELVIRGQLLLMILAPFYHNKMLIISLSSLIWGVNFLLPSIIGAILLLGYRLNR